MDHEIVNNPRFQQGSSPAQPLPLREQQGFAVAQECEKFESEASSGGELKTLLDSFLEPIIKSVGASGGAIRVLSPDGRELHVAGAAGLPPGMLACEGPADLHPFLV